MQVNIFRLIKREKQINVIKIETKFCYAIHFFLNFYFPVQEQISERETQEIIQQSSLIQDTSHQYARFTSSISDNSKQIIKFFFLCLKILINNIPIFILVEHPYAQLQNFQKTEINQVNRYYPFTIPVTLSFTKIHF